MKQKSCFKFLPWPGFEPRTLQSNGRDAPPSSIGVTCMYVCMFVAVYLYRTLWDWTLQVYVPLVVAMSYSPQSLARFVPSCEAGILLACLVFFSKNPLLINYQLTNILDCLTSYCLPSCARF